MDNNENIADKNSFSESKYRVLGASGLVVDEDGEILSASEKDAIFGREPVDDGVLKKTVSKFPVISELEDKSNPAYWYHYYDPRYCGPSREDYIEKMARRYRESGDHLKEKADQNQREAELRGLRLDTHLYSNSLPSWGIKDRKGESLVDYDRYANIGEFHNGLARVQDKKSKKFGFIDVYGKEVIPCKWKSVGDFSEYLAGVQDDNRKCGYIDLQGELVIPCEWKEAWPFKEGMAIVQDSNNKLGYIDKTGNLVIPCRWKKASGFEAGRAIVSEINHFFRKNKFVYIDKEGNVVGELKE